MDAPRTKPYVVDDKSGFLPGITAYVMWGFFPIYFKITQSVPALEILAHRILWSVPFLMLVILIRKQWPALVKALKNKRLIALLLLASISLAVNWCAYIWAVQQDQIFQASLAYYLNPLMYILVGVFFFGEKLSRWQFLAVVLAALGVTVLTVSSGALPILTLLMAVSWTIYGVIRKQTDIGSMPGLLIETTLLLPAAGFYVAYLAQTGALQFGQAGPSMTALLLAAGPLTVIPLLAFTVAAKKLTLTTLGFLQYIGPTLQFAIAIYYGEAFTPAHAICFGLIWLAVILFMWDRFRAKPVAQA